MCKLNRSIYNLKQSFKSWNIYFDKMIKMYGFVRNGEEPYVYKWANDSIVIFLVLYINDILLIENKIPALQSIKLWLSSQFYMKDLGEVSCILGMNIYRDRSRRILELSQSMYIDTMLKQFNIKNFKRSYLLISHKITLSKKDCLTIPQERESNE